MTVVTLITIVAKIMTAMEMRNQNQRSDGNSDIDYDNTDADDTVQLKVGTAAGGEQIIAAPAQENGFVEQDGVAAVGTRMSTSSGAKIEANSTAFTFADAAADPNASNARLRRGCRCRLR